MMPTHEIDGQGWKAHIITNPPEEQEDWNEDRFAYRAEVKSRIVNVVLGSDGLTRSAIVREVNKKKSAVNECLDELCEEGVLEVEKV